MNKMKVFLMIMLFQMAIFWDNQDENFKVRTTKENGKTKYLHSALHEKYYNNKECQTSFECWSTGCCRDGKCKDAKECEKIVKMIYGIVGGVAFLVLIGALIYTIVVINKIRKSVDIIQKRKNREKKRMEEEQNREKSEERKKQEREIK